MARLCLSLAYNSSTGIHLPFFFSLLLLVLLLLLLQLLPESEEGPFVPIPFGTVSLGRLAVWEDGVQKADASGVKSIGGPPTFP